MSLEKEIRGLKPKTVPYKHFVGKGLFVFVLPNGVKRWRIKYRFDGRERTYSVGVYPKISVAAALETRDRVKDQIRDGIDPAAAKKEAAKLNPNKPDSKNLFKLSLSVKGNLSIETSSRLIILTPLQTEALRSFLASQKENEKK